MGKGKMGWVRVRWAGRMGKSDSVEEMKRIVESLFLLSPGFQNVLTHMKNPCTMHNVFFVLSRHSECSGPYEQVILQSLFLFPPGI